MIINCIRQTKSESKIYIWPHQDLICLILIQGGSVDYSYEYYYGDYESASIQDSTPKDNTHKVNTPEEHKDENEDSTATNLDEFTDDYLEGNITLQYIWSRKSGKLETRIKY